MIRRLLHTLTLVTFALAAVVARADDARIGILVFDGFLTSDVTAPIEVFGAATKKAWFSEYEVEVIATTRQETVTSEEGLTLVPDSNIYDAPELDVLIVPSAYDMDPMLENTDLIDFIERQRDSGEWLASNCSGAYLLGEAGALNGKRATTWAGGESALQSSYPDARILEDETVVVDQNIVTSNGGPVSYLAAFELLERLSSEDFARDVKETIQFNRLERGFE